MSQNFLQKKLSYLRIFASVLSVCIPLSIASEARADRLANVNFDPGLLLIDNQVGTVRGITTATVDSGTGSVTIETDNPFLYFNAFALPDPNVDLPCAFGTPGEIAGLTKSYTFNFGNRAQCTDGIGYYALFYNVRVTNNTGAFPSSSSFQAMEPVYGQVFEAPSGGLGLSDKAYNGLALTVVTPKTVKTVTEPSIFIGLAVMGLAALSLKLKNRYRRNTHVQANGI